MSARVVFLFRPVRFRDGLLVEVERTGVTVFPGETNQPRIGGEVRVTVSVPEDDPIKAIRQAAAMVGIALEEDE